MQTRSLETLVRIHQVQSFSQAAALQNMTLSALSMQMRALETELNAALFDRAFRPPRLTPQGRRVALQAERLLEEQSKLRALCGSDEDLTGHFRLGFIQSVSVRLLPSFLMVLRGAAPNARFQFETGLSEPLSEQVETGQLDGAVITHTAGSVRQLRADVIATEAMAIAVPKVHADTPTTHLPEVLPFVQFRPSTGIGKLIAASIEDLTTKPREVLVLDGIEACVECVKAGLGYTFLPQPDLERYKNGNVCIRIDPTGQMTRELALVTRNDAISSKWRPQILQILTEVAA
ncbi:MAG: LysR family transcriptional regulator [Rhodobacteraceae bacterium]|nr:LysR family transcriptional regulator [Paracoccaceae bacterium]